MEWTRRLIRFHDVKHPASMGPQDVRDFLSHLALDRNVAASTQRFRLPLPEVLGKELGWLDDLERAKKPQRLPVVLTRSAVPAVVLACLDGPVWLMASFLIWSRVTP